MSNFNKVLICLVSFLVVFAQLAVADEHLSNDLPDKKTQKAESTSIINTPNFALKTAEKSNKAHAMGTKIAFVGDTGAGEDFQEVLDLIKREDAELTIALGDTSYEEGMEAHWDTMVRETLGDNDPALIVAGNHDYEDSDYEQVLGYGEKRLNKAREVKCQGSYGEQMTCQYKNLYFVLSSIGTNGSRTDHEEFIESSLKAAPEGLWRVCNWHKNQKYMQVGKKSDEVGWKAYETCRQQGAFIATGHEHSYSRTYLLSNMSEQKVASYATDFTVNEGNSFAFVSGLGGMAIRSQKLEGDWWAKIYTATQNARYGVLFGTFYENYAMFYFKNIDGEVIDEFVVNKGY